MVGAVAIAIGVVVTMGMMFLGRGVSAPLQLLPVLLVAAGGLALLAIPGDPSAPKSREVRHPLLLMAGIFFTFATIGPLLMLVFRDSSNAGLTPVPIAGLVSAFIAGSLSCGWAAAFTFRRWWLIPITILAQILVPGPLFDLLARIGLLQNFGDLSDQVRRGTLAMQAVACVIIGHILLVRFIRASENEQARGRAELDMARRMHESLVPDIELQTPRLAIFGRSTPSSEMGGDLIDVVHGDGVTDIFLVDVSGHGVRAGVVMAMIKAATRMRLRSCASLETLLAELDRVLSDLIEPGMFATLACLRFEADGASVGLAGHLPVLRVRDGVVEELQNDALPLGLGMEEKFALRRADVLPGDTLVLFTDGFTEVQGAGGELLGLDRFKAIVARHAAREPRAAADAIIAEANAFGTTGDDQTIAIVRICEPR